MKRITYEIESDIETSHWWFVGRRALLHMLLSVPDASRPSLLVDVGCGVGSNLMLFDSMGYRVIGLDSEIYSLSYARKRHPSISLINGDLLTLPLKPDSIDLIIATDILEHLEEDTRGIREIHRTLKKEGRAVFTAPAFKFLWGTQDIAGMHQRRYSKKELLKKIEGQGFRVIRSSYFNFLLFFPILLVRWGVRCLNLTIQSENRINFPLMNYILRQIFLLEPYLLRYISFPFGVSIFCIAQK